MKALVLVAVLAAGPVGAETLTYAGCIDMLQAMIGNQKAMGSALNGHILALADSDKAPAAIAKVSAIKARDEVYDALKDYIAALGDACQAIR